RVALDDARLGDIELALLGILPDHQLLGGAIRGGPPAPGARVLLRLGRDDGTPPTRTDSPGSLAGTSASDERAGAAVAREVMLVDEESTPIATLVVDGRLPTGARGALLLGRLVPERVRESGSAEPRVDAATLAAGWDHVVVLARPLTEDDAELPTGATVLVLVPDNPAATDGIPTSAAVELARDATAHLGDGVVIRTAPLRWRDPASDRALAGLLAATTGAPVDLRHPAPEVDPAAVSWLRVRADLETAVDDAPLPGLNGPATAALRRWRPPRHRRGLVVMFTGLSGSGKSTLARSVRDALAAGTRTVGLLDGDVVRRLLSSGLGFDRAGREQNVRRIGFVATEAARHGGLVLCAPIAPYRSTRAEVRRMVRDVGDFVLVHVSTPLEVCEQRDLKGLYAAARAGRIPEFTGVSDPYETPDDADLVVDTSRTSVADATALVITHLREQGWLPEETRPR
ncbi:MAG: adenylyl-sulfate kinase, partial [Dermatophilaceae bacterium]